MDGSGLLQALEEARASDPGDRSMLSVACHLVASIVREGIARCQLPGGQDDAHAILLELATLLEQIKDPETDELVEELLPLAEAITETEVEAT